MLKYLNILFTKQAFFSLECILFLPILFTACLESSGKNHKNEKLNNSV